MMEVFDPTLSDDYIQALDINDLRLLIEEATDYAGEAEATARSILGLEWWEPITTDPDDFIQEFEIQPDFRLSIAEAEHHNSRAGRAIAIRATAILALDKRLEGLDHDVPF